MERFVYVQKNAGFEKRNVKVGVSDFTSAEIQEGLKPGEIVSIELPKEDKEKKAKEVATQKKSGGESGTAATKTAAPSSGTRTNRTKASAVSTTTLTNAPKAGPARVVASTATATSIAH